MKLEISNFRGISKAELDISNTVLIAGPNGSGKTSIAMALAAASSGKAAPWDGITAKDSRNLLRIGAKRGHATLRQGDLFKTINYPGGSATGELDSAVSSVAAGIISPADMKPKDLSSLLYSLLKAEPTQEDLASDIGVDMSAQLWPIITSEGWDAAYSRARERGTKAKGQWEGVTGENYGSSKAANWQPEGAENYNLSMTLEQLEDQIKKGNAYIDKIKADATLKVSKIEQLQSIVYGAEKSMAFLAANNIDPLNPPNAKAEIKAIEQSLERKATEEQASKYDNLQKEYESLQVRINELNQQINLKQPELLELKEAIEKMPKPGVEIITADCPSCGSHLVVIDAHTVKLLDVEPESPEDIAAKTAAINAAIEKYNLLQSEMNHLAAGVQNKTQALNNLTPLLELSKEAINKLESMPITAEFDSNRINILTSIPQHVNAIALAIEANHELELIKQEPSNDESLKRAEEALGDFKQTLFIKQRIAQASSINKLITSNEVAINSLSPNVEGLRSRIMAEKLGLLNERLEALSKIASWPTVHISSEIKVIYGDTLYGWELSESERFRCRVILQAAISELDNSPIIVIDAADILDRVGRNNLIKTAKIFAKPVVITMTMNSKEEVPNLQALQMNSFWINQNGELELVF